MPFTLAPGVSFGEPSGRFVFLHVPSDRYLMISPTAECTLRRLIDGDCPIPEDDGLLRPLCDLGLLTLCRSAEAIAPCLAAPPERSALDAPEPGLRAPAVVRALFAFLRARGVLHRQGLGNALARVERTRSRPRSGGSADGVSTGVAAFDRPQ